MADKRSEVSVILPTYDRAGIVSDSIQSVLDQTFENFELIVVDDASNDDTDEVVQRFTDNRIRYIKHEQNRGAPAARNTGIEAAVGDIIAFQDSDDRWYPRKLEKQLQVFETVPSDVGVVYTGMNRGRDHSEVYLPYTSIEKAEGNIQSSLQQQNFIPTQVAAVRQDCFDTVGLFDENVSPLEDWELWIRISKQFEFRLVDETLVTGEVLPDSLSTNQHALVEARKRIIDKHHDYFSDRTFARHSFYVGHGSMKLQCPREARFFLLQAIRAHPHPQYMAALVLSILSLRFYIFTYRQYKSWQRSDQTVFS